jgi:hypothetical protein
LKILSKSGSAVLFVLRSQDRDRLRFTAKLVSGGRTLTRETGSVRPDRSRFVKLAARGRRSARLVVVLKDPQGNRRHLARSLRLRR